MPYEEYTPAEAEINKIIKPGIDDNTNGEVDEEGQGKGSGDLYELYA